MMTFKTSFAKLSENSNCQYTFIDSKTNIRNYAHPQNKEMGQRNYTFDKYAIDNCINF